MPAGRLPISAFLPPRSQRLFAVSPVAGWWRVVSEEGEVARYRTQETALDGAFSLAEAMRRLGLQAEVLLDDPLEPTAGPA